MALNDTKIRSLKPKEKEYKMSDTQGLYLLIKPNGSKLWYLKYRFEGKETRAAYGPYPDISLADAREKRDQDRRLLANGINPNVERKTQKEKSNNTFELIARMWHASNQQWSQTHSERVIRRIEKNLFPSIGDRDIASLKTKDLLEPIKIVEQKGHLDLALRLRQQTTAIMRFAVQNGVIEYNPANDMAGAISTKKTTHRPALSFNQIQELLKRLDNYNGRELTKLAVKLTLLTFVRSSELRFARWSEINFEQALWTIPDEREAIVGVKHSNRGSKMRTTHLVPLSKQAMNVLKQIQKISGNHELIFIGDHNTNKPMSENTVNNALRGMGYDTKTEVCGHGFRAIACSALIESGLWTRDGVEKQMSHQERSNVRAAYIHKAEHLNERQLMMQWWANYLDANKEKSILPNEFNNNHL